MKPYCAAFMAVIILFLLPAGRADAGGEEQLLVTSPWSTYYGGSGSEVCEAVAADAAGNTFIVGHTQSIDFPITAGAFQTSLSGTNDAFIVKFDASGQRLWATYFGGSDRDWGSDVAVASDGSIIVVGTTYSSNLPVTPGAFQTSYGGKADAFIARFDANGTLTWASYFGGRGEERGLLAVGTKVAIDVAGNILITGGTESSNLPVTSGAMQSSKGGGPSTSDGYVAKFTAAGGLLWATYCGGSAEDCGLAITTDAQQCVLVTGCTASNDFPVSPGALQSVNGGSRDGFILKLNAGGSRVWCTYFGGTEYEGFNTITTDAANAVYLVGRTSSANYPVTSGVYQNSFHGYIDVAILKLSSGGACLISSFFGGSAIGGNSGGDEGFGILVDPSGCIYISGTTGSVDLPVVNALQPVYPAVYNAFAAKFDASLGTLLWSTFLGGSNGDNGNDGLARDASGDVCVVGSTRSYDFPIHAAWQPTYAGNSDAFVIWLNSDGQLPGYNAPPIAMAAATPSQGSVQLPVSFSSAGSYDPDGTITSYAWSFGDGGTSTDANPAHVYQTAGTYTATLTVTDDDNATASAAVTVTVSSANSFVYVFDQSVTRIPSGNKWKGQTVVTIYDDLDQPVSGALVTASYVGPNAGIVSGTTVANGSVTLQTAAKNNPSGTWCFTITDVQAAGYVFNGAIGEVTACETPPKLATDDNTPWTPELHVHPNPVRSAAVIEYSLPEAGTVSMRVYDILGRMIANAVDSPHPAGRHTVVFDASALPNGMYLCRMEANAQVRTALMIIAR